MHLENWPKSRLSVIVIILPYSSPLAATSCSMVYDRYVKLDLVYSRQNMDWLMNWDICRVVTGAIPLLGFQVKVHKEEMQYDSHFFLLDVYNLILIIIKKKNTHPIVIPIDNNAAFWQITQIVSIQYWRYRNKTFT